MLAFIGGEMDELGNQAELAHIEKILREGAGADRQLAVWERTQDINAVVDHIIRETYEGLPIQPADVLRQATTARQFESDSTIPKAENRTAAFDQSAVALVN